MVESTAENSSGACASRPLKCDRRRCGRCRRRHRSLFIPASSSSHAPASQCAYYENGGEVLPLRRLGRLAMDDEITQVPARRILEEACRPHSPCRCERISMSAIHQRRRRQTSCFWRSEVERVEAVSRGATRAHPRVCPEEIDAAELVAGLRRQCFAAIGCVSLRRVIEQEDVRIGKHGFCAYGGRALAAACRTKRVAWVLLVWMGTRTVPVTAEPAALHEPFLKKRGRRGHRLPSHGVRGPSHPSMRQPHGIRTQNENGQSGDPHFRAVLLLILGACEGVRSHRRMSGGAVRGLMFRDCS